MAQTITARRSSRSDDLYTPREAFTPIAAWCSQYKHIWEPCCGKYHLVGYMEDLGITVTATDITHGLEFDVRTAVLPSPGIQAIVTNPPYSIRKEIVQVIASHGLPYAMLMPTNTINRAWAEQYGMQLIPLHKRVRFIGRPTSAPFDVCWFIGNSPTPPTGETT